MVVAAACVAPPAELPPAVVVQRKTVLVRMHLSGLPAPTWTCIAAHESGAVVERNGVGEMLELELPPGPCSLRLQCDGKHFERPLHVRGEESMVDWRLDRQDGDGAALRGRNSRSSANISGVAHSTCRPMATNGHASRLG